MTQSDIVQLVAEERDPGILPVTCAMTSPVQTIESNATVQSALDTLQRLRIHRLPVVSEGQVVGLLTMDGLLETQNRKLASLRLETERLASEATHDPLTHLSNRRIFDAGLPREVARAKRSGRQLGLLMVDIDHFKKINDDYGHQTGDTVLRELAGRLVANVRRADLLARYGGEEFVVLASVPGERDLAKLAEKLRRVVERTPFIQNGGHSLSPPSGRLRSLEPGASLHLTISIGAALLGPGIDSGDVLVRAADEALYAAKEAGRNCVRIGRAPPSVAPSPISESSPLSEPPSSPHESRPSQSPPSHASTLPPSYKQQPGTS